MVATIVGNMGSNLTNKYNPQERCCIFNVVSDCSNLTNKYNPQEQTVAITGNSQCSNLTNKYNPQERHRLTMRL